MSIRDDLAQGRPLLFDGAMEPYTDGLYLMTPFRRVALITRILEALQ